MFVYIVYKVISLTKCKDIRNLLLMVNLLTALCLDLSFYVVFDLYAMEYFLKEPVYIYYYVEILKDVRDLFMEYAALININIWAIYYVQIKLTHL